MLVHFNWILSFVKKTMIRELKNLCKECRSNSCIEHATGIMEELKTPENLSRKISTTSLTGGDKKVYMKDPKAQNVECITTQYKLVKLVLDVVLINGKQRLGIQ